MSAMPSTAHSIKGHTGPNPACVSSRMRGRQAKQRGEKELLLMPITTISMHKDVQQDVQGGTQTGFMQSQRCPRKEGKSKKSPA